jgi:hypothetical protein
MQDKTRDALAQLLVHHYWTPHVQTEEVVQVREVEEEVVQQEPFTETVERDDGPHPGVYAISGLGLAAAAVLFALKGTDEPMLPLVALLASVLAAGVLWKLWRNTKSVTMKKMRDVTRTVTRKVEEMDTVEHVTRSTERVRVCGRGRVDFEAAVVGEHVFMTGPRALTDTVRLDLPTVHDPGAVFSAEEEAERLFEDIPWVLDGQIKMYSAEDGTDGQQMISLRGEEAHLRDHFETVRETFEQLHHEAVSFQVVPNASSLVAWLEPVAEVGGDETPSAFRGLTDRLDARDMAELETLVDQWQARWGVVHGTLTRARTYSIYEQVAPDCYELGDNVQYSSFNFYCPDCNKEAQDELLARDYDVNSTEPQEPVRYSTNTRCVFLPGLQRWQCRACERETANPIPIHRTLDEVLWPTYDFLMQENKNERLRYHIQAREKQRDLMKESEIETDRMQHEHLNGLFALSEEMERFRADIAGEQEAIASMTTILLDQRQLQNEAIMDVQRFTRQTRERIDQRTKRVIAEVDEVKDKQMQLLSQELDALSRAKRIEDEKRDATQRQIVENQKKQMKIAREEGRANRKTMRQQGKASRQTMRQQGAMNRQTMREEGEATRDTMREGHSRIEEAIDRQSGISMAIANEMGLDPGGGSWRPDKKISDWWNDLKSNVRGDRNYQREKQKLE